ncbi:hypothetical protein IAR50_007055 [Cryptococcus sp. DSM 104548]
MSPSTLRNTSAPERLGAFVMTHLKRMSVTLKNGGKINDHHMLVERFAFGIASMTLIEKAHVIVEGYQLEGNQTPAEIEKLMKDSYAARFSGLFWSKDKE